MRVVEMFLTKNLVRTTCRPLQSQEKKLWAHARALTKIDYAS